MFELISSVLKYLFITVIYIFLFSIIRLIYLDIRSTNKRMSADVYNAPYIKLINRRDDLLFKVEESYILNGKKIVGRAAGSDIAIGDPFLSPEHAEFYIENGVCHLKDIGSRNGIIVNNSAIRNEVSLKNGDKIELGQMSFLFVDSRKE